VKILRDAFAAMFKDKDFQQDVDKLGWNDELMRGDELNKKVDELVHNELAMGFFRKILQ
jgi:tripartite-type tricarboxylate transporter receptor subunit TctC